MYYIQKEEENCLNWLFYDTCVYIDAINALMDSDACLKNSPSILAIKLLMI